MSSNKYVFVEAVKYIFEKRDRPFTLTELASATGSSPSSLKRAFLEITNQSPGIFIRRLRMELAFRTLQDHSFSILETALASGFDDHSAFSRSFKDTYGYAPSQARQKLNIVSELEHISLKDPDLVELESLELQSVTKKGMYYECAPQAWSDLQSKLTGFDLEEEFSGFYVGVGHDNPHDGEVEENQVRFTAGICLLKRDLGIDRTVVSRGRYARFRFEGKVVNLGLAYHYIYGKWVQTSAFKIRADIPAFIQFEDIPEIQVDQRILIYIPVKVC